MVGIAAEAREFSLADVFILPNRPESTRFFTEREREIASERGSSLGALKADTGAVVNKGGSLLFWLEIGFSDLSP